jgi:hypothetical protein
VESTHSKDLFKIKERREIKGIKEIKEKEKRTYPNIELQVLDVLK